MSDQNCRKLVTFFCVNGADRWEVDAMPCVAAIPPSRLRGAKEPVYEPAKTASAAAAPSVLPCMQTPMCNIATCFSVAHLTMGQHLDFQNKAVPSFALLV
jgi:hypothetical protein